MPQALRGWGRGGVVSLPSKLGNLGSVEIKLSKRGPGGAPEVFGFSTFRAIYFA